MVRRTYAFCFEREMKRRMAFQAPHLWLNHFRTCSYVAPTRVINVSPVARKCVLIRLYILLIDWLRIVNLPLVFIGSNNRNLSKTAILLGSKPPSTTYSSTACNINHEPQTHSKNPVKCRAMHMSGNSESHWHLQAEEWRKSLLHIGTWLTLRSNAMQHIDLETSLRGGFIYLFVPETMAIANAGSSAQVCGFWKCRD